MMSHGEETKGAFDDQRKTISSKRSERPQQKVQFQDTRVPRDKMNPQSRRYLDKDINELFQYADDNQKGAMKFQQNGLISFNRFMHLFIIITRHSKEQFIKEQQKVVDKRRRAFKLKDWKSYEKIL